MLLIYLPFGLRRNPVWRDSSNVKRERAVGDGYGIETVSSDSGILLGIILYFCHFLSDFYGFNFRSEELRVKNLLPHKLEFVGEHPRVAQPCTFAADAVDECGKGITGSHKR